MLGQATIFLTAAVLLVPICRKLGLGAVLGYLIAGMLLGPSALRLVSDVETILHISEFGVVLLLFVIGLELEPARLWVLRRSVFGLGSAQVLATGVALAVLGYWFGLSWEAAMVAGLGLALSSTAFVMQTLAEKGQLSAQHGRDAFSILLFQDLAVIPLLALLPLLGAEHVNATHTGWHAGVKGALVIAAVIAADRTVVRPLFRIIITFGGREIFTAAALLLVLGSSFLMVWIGLSMSLGAFLAGVLLADSEYRHELEAAIEPFKGLLLGLFFMAVGMSADISLVASHPVTVIGLVALLMSVKTGILFLVSRTFGSTSDTSLKLGLYLAQGGEFAFVLFGLAESYTIFDKKTADLLIVVVTISMLLSPLVLVAEEKFAAIRSARTEAPPEYDTIGDEENPVIIAGFGRFGQVVSRILYARHIHFTALDANPQQVDFVRKYGNKIYFGDPSRVDLLYAAKVDKAKLFVLAVDDVETSVKIAEVVRKHFPHVPIYARARNRYHTYKLMDLDVKLVVRETLLSSLELSRDVLKELGINQNEADRTIATFREFDEKLLVQQHAIYQDEAQLIQTSKQAADELKSLFEAAAIAEEKAQKTQDTKTTLIESPGPG
ncbi:MAG TPA: monovalent cation:proton antiporter-2 (CPA2) family protein [Burkholderiales bacterium]|nr:monovalent cation:proton antiporter-2 (CPA2) family protein [Burkholderiales bacterium]